MRRYRSDKEIDELIDLARTYCETRAEYRLAKHEGRLSAQMEEEVALYLKSLDARLTLMKSNSSVDQQQARTTSNVLPFPFQLQTSSERRLG